MRPYFLELNLEMKAKCIFEKKPYIPLKHDYVGNGFNLNIIFNIDDWVDENPMHLYSIENNFHYSENNLHIRLLIFKMKEAVPYCCSLKFGDKHLFLNLEKLWYWWLFLISVNNKV